MTAISFQHRFAFPFLALVLLFLVLLSVGVAGGEEHTVDDDEGSADFTDIQIAIDASSDGDTIHVMNGTYAGDLLIDRSVTILGPENGTAEIVTDDTIYGIRVVNDSVHLKDLLLRNQGGSFGSFVVAFTSAANGSIEDCTLNSTIGMGVLIEGSTNISLLNNTINQSVAMRTSDQCTIEGNILGAWVDISNGCDDNEVRNNEARDPESGTIIMLMWNCDGNLIQNNSLKGVLITSSDGNLVSGNTLAEPISIYGGLNTTVEGNEFLASGIIVNPGEAGREVFTTTVISQTNTINGAPIVYLVEESDRTIPSNAGQVIVAYCDNITIEDLSIEGSIGISLIDSTDCVIEDCVLRNSTNGISVFECTGTSIRNVEIENSGEDGITIRRSFDTRISGCDITGATRFGIRLISDESSADVIDNCDITSCGQAGIRASASGTTISMITLGDDQIGLDLVMGNGSLSGIVIEGSLDAGILLSGSGNDLTNITISDSGAGMLIESGSDNKIQNSSFEGNINGLHLTTSSSTTFVRDCRFVNNTKYGILEDISPFSDPKNEFVRITFKGNGKGDISSEPEYENDGGDGFLGIDIDENFYYYLIMMLVCGGAIIVLLLIRSPRKPSISTVPLPQTKTEKKTSLTPTPSASAPVSPPSTSSPSPPLE